MERGSLAGKTALVTGAGQRIGRAVSEALAAAGVNIVAHYPGEIGETRDLCDAIERYGVRSWAVKADFERRDEYEVLVARSLELSGALDILVNNASIFHGGACDAVQFFDVVRHFQVNAWAPFQLSRDFRRLARKGGIVNLLDSRVTGYDFQHVAYIVSKHALWLLTNMTAIDFAPHVTVNAVAPGLILPPPGKDEVYLDALADTVPLKKHGQVQDVADAVLYLLSAPYVTGQVINVDGGRHLMEYGSGSHPHR